MHAEDRARGDALQQEGLSRLLSEVQGPRVDQGLMPVKGGVDSHRRHAKVLKGEGQPSGPTKNLKES